MPRETVRDSAGLYNPQIGWSNGTVQLGLETASGESLVDVLDDNYSDSKDAKSIWSSLDRDGINRLIRLLRKARDGAFGADA